MSKVNDGGAAFPGPDVRSSTHGMTLRDWFAGQAIYAAVKHSQDEPFDTAEDLANWLYEFADAMLATREHKP